MLRRPPRSTRTDTLFPHTTLFRSAELIRITPDPLTRVFFSDSGSTSVEVALKMALGYWFNIGEARSRILVMEHSYHGDTIGAMSVGARGVYNRAWQPLPRSEARREGTECGSTCRPRWSPDS